MSHVMSLKEAERKAFRSTFQDGLWDINLGLLLLAGGLGPFLTSVLPIPWILLVVLSVVAFAYLIFWGGKKFITTPRIGLVKFGPARKTKLKKTTTVLIVSALLGLITFAAVAMGLTQTNQIPLLAIEYIWAAQAIVVFSLGAYYLDVNRFYLYGVLYAAPVPVGFTLLVSTDLPGLLLLPFIISSGIMLLLGTILFARFLTHYPLPPEGLPLEEALNGSRQ